MPGEAARCSKLLACRTPHWATNSSPAPSVRPRSPIHYPPATIGTALSAARPTPASGWPTTQPCCSVPYFLVTFTVPQPLHRLWMRSHPGQDLDLLFATSAPCSRIWSATPSRSRASLGMLGLLHTWSRTLIYHPHVHYLVPAGGQASINAGGFPVVPSSSSMSIRWPITTHPLSSGPSTRCARPAQDLARSRLEAALGGPIASPPVPVRPPCVISAATSSKTATGDRDLPLLPRWPGALALSRQHLGA